MTKTKDFPTFYPDELKPISWCIDGKAAGPQKFYTKYVHYSKKGSPYFMKNAMMTILTENGINRTGAIDKMVDYLISNFTVYVGYNDTEFNISAKKDENKRQTFDKLTWQNHIEECGIDKKFAMNFLKTMLRELNDYYNKLI